LPSSVSWLTLALPTWAKDHQECFFEMTTFARHPWLMIDDGGRPTVTDRLTDLTALHDTGVVLVCIDVSQFHDGLLDLDRVGFPREGEDLVRRCWASLKDAPGWRMVLVMTKNDRLGEQETWPVDTASQLEFLRIERLTALADLYRSSERVHLLFVGRRDGSTSGPPEINVGALHDILQTK
jgi:hypothetical protein